MKPSLAPVLFVAILLSGLITINTLNFGIVNAATSVTGRIESDATWTKAGSPYTLTGNVLVSTGVTLTIEAGVTVNLTDYLLMVNGTLRAIGTSSDKIQFRGGTITITEYSNSWNEETGSGCIIEYTNCDSQLVVIGNPKISSCLFETVGVGGNTVFTSNVVNSDANFGGSVTVSGNTFNGIVRLNSDSGAPVVSSNTIAGGLSISYTEGLPTISHNIITGEVTAGGAPFLLDSNTITGAMIISSCSGTISNNNIKGKISTSSDDLLISNNIISETDVGIDLTPESPAGSVNVTITGNRINARQNGILVPPTYTAFIYGWYCKAFVSGNIITDCANSAINVGGGESQAGYSAALNNVTIINNRFFSNNYAINTLGIGRIEGNVIVNNYGGISGGGPAVNNIVANNTYGISCDTVEGNFVANNKYGVRGNIVNNNTIINNEVGIASGFSELHYNNIYGNTLNVDYTIAADGNATYNWWGTTDTQAISQSIYDYEEDFMVGRVNFNPILTSLNPSAPSPDTQIPSVDSPLPTATVEPSLTPQPSSSESPQQTPQPSIPELPQQTVPLVLVALAAVALGALLIKKKTKQL